MPDSPTSLTKGRPATADATETKAGNAPVRPLVAAGLLALVILIWGANWPIMKVGLQDIPPFLFAASRMVLGSLTLFAVAALAGELRLPHRADWPIVIWVALLQMAGFVTLISIALQIVPAGRSAILSYTTPLWVVPLAVLFLGEKVGRMKLLGLLAGLAGVAVLFNPLAVDWGDGRALLGNGLLMLAALAWAVNIVQVRGHRWRGTPLSLAPWQTLIASLILVPLAAALDWGKPIDWSWDLAAIVVYNGPIATAFCFWAMVTVNRALPAVTLSLGTLGTPAVGLILSAWWLGEALTATILAGLGFIAAGLVLVALADRRS